MKCWVGSPHVCFLSQMLRCSSTEMMNMESSLIPLWLLSRPSNPAVKLNEISCPVTTDNSTKNLTPYADRRAHTLELHFKRLSVFVCQQQQQQQKLKMMQVLWTLTQFHVAPFKLRSRVLGIGQLFKVRLDSLESWIFSLVFKNRYNFCSERGAEFLKLKRLCITEP